MKYGDIVKGVFLSRPNRFIALVDIDGETHTVHVKNTGRCRELLVPNAEVYLERSGNPNRKTAYDLVTVKKGDRLVNMDSGGANVIAEEWLKSGGLLSHSATVRREVKYGGSRFDFAFTDGDRRGFVEVKGVTLEEDGVALFPDAPTERGVKHLRELSSALNEGYEAYVLFVVQMKGIHTLRPNDVTHKAFGDELRSAASLGVKVIAVDCNVNTEEVYADQMITVDLRSGDTLTV